MKIAPFLFFLFFFFSKVLKLWLFVPDESEKKQQCIKYELCSANVLLYEYTPVKCFRLSVVDQLLEKGVSFFMEPYSDLYQHFTSNAIIM